jgi:sphingolipid delta-4 desaturase
VVGTIRPRRLSKIPFLDRWTAVNFATQAALVLGLVAMFGWDPVKYLAVSALLAVGLHPLGARWIQEHYVFAPGQETYSYYGPLNTVAFNIGYHNEHHDLMTIPWSRLPRVRAAAPEFYDHLHAHRSWTKLLLTFLGDSNVTLFNRIVRAPERRPSGQPGRLDYGSGRNKSSTGIDQPGTAGSASACSPRR